MESDRPNNRAYDQLREVSLLRNFTSNTPGSVLVSFGRTKVLCTAVVEDQVPQFLRGQRQGWLTAEYGMLPGSTSTRTDREAARGKQSGRTVEIQRLIGRSLRQMVDLKRLEGTTIRIDCDVIEADGGTRTAAITGACVAVQDALKSFASDNAIIGLVAAVSVGIVHGQACLDLEYEEDHQADTDMNVVMTSEGGFVEVQGTAEGEPFSREELDKLLAVAEKGINELIELQRSSLQA